MGKESLNKKTDKSAQNIEDMLGIMTWSQTDSKQGIKVTLGITG